MLNLVVPFKGPLARILATCDNLYVQSDVFFMYTCTYVHNVLLDFLLTSRYIIGRGGLMRLNISQETDRSTRQWYLAENFHPSSLRLPREFSRFHVSYSNENYSTTCMRVCLFLLIRYFIIKQHFRVSVYNLYNLVYKFFS